MLNKRSQACSEKPASLASTQPKRWIERRLAIRGQNMCVLQPLEYRGGKPWAATVFLKLLSSVDSAAFIGLIAGIVVGLAITAALFWVMPYLIETPRTGQLDKAGSTYLVDFVRLRRG